MPRSIDRHRPDCPCPACLSRRAGTPKTAHFQTRVLAETAVWLAARPGGARAWLEEAVRAARVGGAES